MPESRLSQANFESNTQHFETSFDRTLKVARFIGLIGFLGGLSSLAALMQFGPHPKTIDQWHTMIHSVRAIFYPCTFGGIVVLLIVGVTIWWRRRRMLNPQRWFRLMMTMIFIAVPALHIWARWSMLKMVEAVEAENLAKADVMWTRLSCAFVLAVAVFLVIAAIGMLKPRFGR